MLDGMSPVQLRLLCLRCISSLFATAIFVYAVSYTAIYNFKNLPIMSWLVLPIAFYVWVRDGRLLYQVFSLLRKT